LQRYKVKKIRVCGTDSIPLHLLTNLPLAGTAVIVSLSRFTVIFQDTRDGFTDGDPGALI